MKRTKLLITSLIFLISLTIVSDTAYAKTFERQDFVQHIETKADLNTAYSWYKVCNPTGTDFIRATNSDFNVSFIINNNKLIKYDIDIKENLSGLKNVTKRLCNPYSTNFTYSNSTTIRTIMENCSNYRELKFVEQYAWKRFTYSNFTFKANSCYDIRITGSYPITFGKNSVNIDNVLGYKGLYFSEYALWLQGWENRTSIWVNNSNSTKINYPLGLFEGTGSSARSMCLNITGLVGKHPLDYDVRIIDNSTNATVPFEIISNTSNSVCLVMIVNLTANTNSSFYVYWGNSSPVNPITFQTDFASVGPNSLQVSNTEFTFKGSIIAGFNNYSFGRNVDGQEFWGTGITDNNGFGTAMARNAGSCEFSQINGSVVKWLNCSNTAGSVNYGALYVFSAYNNFSKVVFSGFDNNADDGMYVTCGDGSATDNSIHYRGNNGVMITGHGESGMVRDAAGIFGCGKDTLSAKAFMYWNASWASLYASSNSTTAYSRNGVGPDPQITIATTSFHSNYKWNLNKINIYIGVTGNSSDAVRETWTWLESKPIVVFSSPEYEKGNNIPFFTSNTSDDSDYNNTLDKGLNVTFNATISDVDNDNVKLIICDASGRSGLGCLNTEFCNTTLSLPGNKSCQLNTSGLADVEYNWTSFACDNNSICVDGINGSFYVTRPRSPAFYANGSTIWSHTGLFSGPLTVENFNDKLNNELAVCQEINGICNISLIFFSDGRGMIEVSLINIQYDVYDTAPPIINSILIEPDSVLLNSSINITVNATDNINVTSVFVAHKDGSFNLTFNDSSKLWKGSMISPSTTGLFELNATAIDSSNLSTTNSTVRTGGNLWYASCPPGMMCILSNDSQATADLIVYPEFINYIPSELIDNGSLVINVTVFNFGGGAGSNFIVGLLIDEISKTNNTISISASNSTLTQFIWNITAGNHTIKVFADYSNTITEQNETNNIASINISVEDSTPPTISSIYTYRGSLNIKVNISDNQNISSAFASVNGTNITLAFNQTTSLYEGTSNSISPGTYTMIIKATDTNGLITTLQTFVTVYAEPIDLEVGKDDLWISNPTPSNQDNIVIYAVIFNTGLNTSSNFSVEFLINNVSNLNSTISISGDNNVTLLFNWTANYGNNTFTVKIDSQNNISELNETNNEVIRTIFVYDNASPTINELILPEIVYSDSQFLIMANITDNLNLSKVNASLNQLEIIMEYNSSSGLYENLTTLSPALGTYPLTITASDSNSLISSLTRELIVFGSQADLSSDLGAIEINPSNVTENEILGINLTIRNQGGTDANNVKIEMQIDGSSKTNNTLSISKASRNLTSFNWNASYGTHNLTIRIDPDNSIIESNESNNFQNITLFVLDITPPSVLTIFANPSNWTNQKTNNISWVPSSDANGIREYEYMINYGNWTSIGLNTSFVTSDLAEGVQTIYVRAADIPGNIAEPSNVSVYIDLTPSNDPVISEWHTGVNWSDHNTPYLSWVDPGDEGSGIQTFSISTDGGNEEIIGYNLSYHGANLTTGIHTLKVKAYDSLNQSSNWSNIITVYIDTSSPGNVLINSTTHPDNNTWYASNTPFFNLSVVGENSGVQGYYYVFDKASNTTLDTRSLWTTNSTINISYLTGGTQHGINGSNTSSSGVPNGIWYLHVLAKDNVGNLGTNTSHFQVNINASKLLISNLSVLNISGTSRIFEFDITNLWPINQSNISWSLDTKNSYVINSTMNITLQAYEKIFVYAQYNFTALDIFNVNATTRNENHASWKNVSVNVN